MRCIRLLWTVGLLFAALLVASTSHAAIERFGVVIGNNTGNADDQELRYAEADASRMHDTLRTLGGFAPANLVLLKGESAETVRRTLIAVNDRVRAAVAGPERQAVLLVYYSGHADSSVLHLGRSSLPLSEVEQIVRGSVADLRLLILDACRSGALTRVKGGTPAPPVAIRMESQLQGEGVLFWTASAANEDAQESDALKGSFFSHYLNSALIGAGDSDGDGRVTIDEAYRYSSENTIRVTSASAAGTQHPTFRYDLRGQGKVALTTLWEGSQNHATVVLPPGKPYLVFAGSNTGAVVGEVGTFDVGRRIRVKAGTYFVRGRGNDSLLEGSFNVAAGETWEVREADLSRTAYARLVRKGGGRSSALETQIGARLHSPLPNGGGWCVGAVAGFGIAWDVATLALRAGACRAAFYGRSLEGDTDEVGLDVRLTRSFDISRLSPFVAIEAGAVLFHQSFVTRGLAPNVDTVGASAAAVLGLSLDLGGGFDLVGEVGAAAYVFSLDEDRRTSFRSSFAFRPTLGLSKAW
ncbi:MAG: caspase family protein [Polyangiaceae bacterium]|nr:caspase family protein [Polyangiaceae bacterium]